eukprot:TRINITY_DN2546_c0_g1_i6.p1 TRINITY_DN2546_c0_g1~~TRINITY_DN2546_c0_g1_i6.p1  ORF type:complete len:247 (-),score=-14.62 TRINITY_DN2546_c0_g1_i6:289-1029(-)
MFKFLQIYKFAYNQSKTLDFNVLLKVCSKYYLSTRSIFRQTIFQQKVRASVKIKVKFEKQPSRIQFTFKMFYKVAKGNNQICEVFKVIVKKKNKKNKKKKKKKKKKKNNNQIQKKSFFIYSYVMYHHIFTKIQRDNYIYIKQLFCYLLQFRQIYLTLQNTYIHACIYFQAVAQKLLSIQINIQLFTKLKNYIFTIIRLKNIFRSSLKSSISKGGQNFICMHCVIILGFVKKYSKNQYECFRGIPQK